MTAPQPTERTPTTRRRHAARGSRVIAGLLSLASTLGLAGWLHQHDAQAAQASDANIDQAASADPVQLAAQTTTTTRATTTSSSLAGTSTTGSPSSASSFGTSKATTTTQASSGLNDGTFTGQSYTNRYGAVQVRITVSGGSITAVDIVRYPDGDNKSIAINNRALPTLVRSALQSQSAKVSNVSGATYTSTGYKQSLQSAIDQSRK